MAERMPIRGDINLLCDAVTWAVQRRRPGTPVGFADVQRHVRVGFVKAQRLLLLMDSYGITTGEARSRTVAVTEEQLPAVLAKLRDLAGEEDGDHG